MRNKLVKLFIESLKNGLEYYIYTERAIEVECR